MRIVSRKTLKEFWKQNKDSEQSLKAWFEEVSNALWKNHAELKQQFGSASIINKKRVVFNIKGNKYRLIVDMEYRIKIVFVVWIGNHQEYDNINVNEVHYVKTDKK